MKATLVHKVPKLDTLRMEDQDLPERLSKQSPDLYSGLHNAKQRQDLSLVKVIEAFHKEGFDVDVQTQTDFKGADGDVVVVVGGDGTVLDVSHNVRTTPIIAINSDPERSVGVFCACAADEARQAAQRVRDGQAITTILHRLRVLLTGPDYVNTSISAIIALNRL